VDNVIENRDADQLSSQLRDQRIACVVIDPTTKTDVDAGAPASPKRWSWRAAEIASDCPTWRTISNRERFLVGWTQVI
jgi:hypothetical protein